MSVFFNFFLDVQVALKSNQADWEHFLELCLNKKSFRLNILSQMSHFIFYFHVVTAHDALNRNYRKKKTITDTTFMTVFNMNRPAAAMS